MKTKFSTKRIIAKFAALLCLMSMMPLTARAQFQTVINETSSEELPKPSTIYVGEVVVNGVTVIKYLYSGDVTISYDLVNNVHDCLNGMADKDYATLLNGHEFDYTSQPAAVGLAHCSNSELVAAMDENWSSARDVGALYYPHKIVTSEVNSNLYDLDNGFKTVIDAKNAERLATINNPIDAEKCIVSHIGSNTNESVYWDYSGNPPVKHVNRTISYSCEVTTVVYTKVELQPLSLADNADNSYAISANNELVYDVTLGRTLQAGGWNTFCAPFDISSEQIESIFGENTKVRELSSSDFNSTTKELTLNFAETTSIDAGKPYLVWIGNENAVTNPTFNGVTISNSTTTTTTDYADFVPVMNPTSLTGGDKSVLFVTGGDKLTYPNTTGNINGFRAYFKLKEGAAANAQSFIMSFDDETTDIVEMRNEELEMRNVNEEMRNDAAGCYDLQGRRIESSKLNKGVYIVSGRKVVIK